MKTSSFWALIALLGVDAALAQSTTKTTAASSTTASATSSCTAPLITTVCDYKSPGPEFAIASDGKAFCWSYCNSHQPCNFVIFVAGNPYTGTGTCWVYPSETFDESAADTDCGNPVLSVFGKPVCNGESTATTTSGACAATASPSAAASGCGYEAPGDCFNDCSASGGAADCLSQCVKSDSCNYVVFNPHNDSESPYASGSCWMYANGTLNAGAMSSCSGKPEQYAYTNPCPKPTTSSSSLTSSATGSAAGSASGSASASGSGTRTGTMDAAATTGGDGNSAAAALSFTSPLAIGMAILLWQWFA